MANLALLPRVALECRFPALARRRDAESAGVTSRTELLTVGHSTHPLDGFLGLLGGAQVELVADVRRFPGSRRHPQYGEEALASSLADVGLGYEHLPQLGGRRPVKPDSPNDGWRVAAFRGYADHLRTPEFAAGRARLAALAAERRTSIMCAEALPWRCHRRLIADVFVAPVPSKPGDLAQPKSR